MKITKKLLISLIMIAITFGSYTDTFAMEQRPNLNKQLWNAVFENNQAEVIRLLGAGADVNAPNPDNDGSTILSRFVFSEMGDRDKHRHNIIIALLAAGADPESIRDKMEAYHQKGEGRIVYMDQGTILLLLDTIQTTPEEIKHIIPGLMALRRVDPNSSRDTRKLIASALIQDLVTQKYNQLIRRGFTLNDIKNIDEARFRKAIELSIIRALKKQKVID